MAAQQTVKIHRAIANGALSRGELHHHGHAEALIFDPVRRCVRPTDKGVVRQVKNIGLIIKTRIELAGDVAQRRDKIWLRMPHHLDREVARVGYERVIGPCGHVRSGSGKPSIIASRVADVISGRLDKSVDPRCKPFGFTRIIMD